MHNSTRGKIGDRGLSRHVAEKTVTKYAYLGASVHGNPDALNAKKNGGAAIVWRAA